MKEDIDKDINDVIEDKREEDESKEALAENPGNEHDKNDIEEDKREEGESIDDIKNALKDALYENSMLREKLKRTEDERDEAHRIFLGTGRESEPEEKKTFSTIKNDIK